jgi:thioredoxin 1
MGWVVFFLWAKLMKNRKTAKTPPDPWRGASYGALIGALGVFFYAFLIPVTESPEDMKYLKVVTDSNWDQVVLQSKQPVLVDFWAPWCGPCRMEGPVVAQVAKEEAGLAVVGKVNADDAPELMQKFGIQAIPTLIVFKGGKPFKTFTGLTDGSDLKAAIESAGRS